MSTVKVKGQHVRVGDDLWSGGIPHRITRIENYVHPVVTRNEVWRTAKSDGPGGVGKAAWGITLSCDHGYAVGYEISVRPGEPPYVNEPPADDYPCPYSGIGTELFKLYEADGLPGLWTEWLTANGHMPKDGAQEGRCARCGWDLWRIAGRLVLRHGGDTCWGEEGLSKAGVHELAASQVPEVSRS